MATKRLKELLETRKSTARDNLGVFIIFSCMISLWLVIWTPRVLNKCMSTHLGHKNINILGVSMVDHFPFYVILLIAFHLPAIANGNGTNGQVKTFSLLCQVHLDISACIFNLIQGAYAEQ